MELHERIAALKAKPANIRSRELRSLLEAMGYESRSGKHQRVYRKPGGGRPIIVPEHGKGKNVYKWIAQEILDRLEKEIEEGG
jgi:predicted RNA binding protein YcfA (HicA-like mRNA interferase family)